MTIHAFTAKQTQALEQQFITNEGISEYELMQRAAKALQMYINTHFAHKKEIQILCGTGNNGGDGYTLALYLLDTDVVVHCYEKQPPSKTSAQQARMALIQAGLTPQHWTEYSHNSEALIVDALLGIGLNKPVEGDYLELINQINESGSDILSADIPSGVCADTGSVLGASINRCHVVSFITRKLGTVLGDSVALIKHCHVDTLGMSDALLLQSGYHVLDEQVLAGLTKKREPTIHKYQLGHVLLIGGNAGYGGAIILATKAASYSGVGLVSVYTHADHKEPLLTHCPECMIHDHHSDLQDLIAKATAIVIGPGLGRDAWAKKALTAVLESSKPVVCDADALTLIAQDPTFKLHPEMILTPHEGEAVRLHPKQESDRETLLKKLYHKTQATVVLKGNLTLITDDGETVYLCPLGNPGLATAGTGDVLAGIIGGFLAQTQSRISAATAGVYLHALCGDMCRDMYSERSMTALDLVETLKKVF